MKRLALAAAALTISCSSPTPPGALLALVEFGPMTTAKCVVVVVRTDDGAEVRANPVVTDRSQPLKVGIARGTLPDEVLVYGVGYADVQCMTTTVPFERTEDGVGTFKPGRASTVKLELVRRPNAKDGDGDGYASVATGGDDCNDDDRSIHPGALEVCGDGADNDCDRASDCEEGVCLDKGCGLSAGAVCRTPKCAELICSDDLDNDGDGLRDCPDPDCAGQACRNAGTCQNTACQGASTEKDLCADGSDNDGDGKLDCADPDCSGSLCNSGDACLAGARCDSSAACVGGTPVTCTSPPSGCFKASGACNPGDGGCDYSPDLGKSCNDSNGCTTGDTCLDGGACLGAAISCVAPASCLSAVGCSADAGCTFSVAIGDSCDDGNGCTSGDLCLADAGCAGGPISCVPNACQVFSNQCGADAGCVFNPRDAGAPCDGGICNGGGACVRSFPYPPSNFTESQLPTPAAPTTLNCTLTLDSNLADGGVGFGGWCGNAEPPYRVIPQPNGRDAVLLGFSDLELGPDASVRLQGERPVIFAATGNLSVLGQVVTTAGQRTCSDGGVGGAASGNRGGGAGGFGSAGASGGNSGGAGGIVNGEPLLVPLRGGCPGGNGARSGGAVQLSAAGNLTITGSVSAPGRGGAGGAAAYGGGQGAGSGGGVLLEGLFVLVGPIGAVTANGGGGGEGAGLFFSGESGESASSSTATPAGGGDSANGGAKGGNGASGTAAAGGGSDVSTNGGGGGGAGVGRVRINAVSSCSFGNTAVLSPTPTSNLKDAGCP